MPVLDDEEENLMWIKQILPQGQISGAPSENRSLWQCLVRRKLYHSTAGDMYSEDDQRI